MCKGKKGTAAFMVIIGVILVWTTGVMARLCPPQSGKMWQAQCCITFTGEVLGGTLIMSENLGRNVPYVAIETKAGEPVEKVIERLANTIEDTNPFDWMITPPSDRKFKEKIVTSSGGELQGLVGSCIQYMTAGTEAGLGIPQPPHSLTANYDPNLKKIELKWVNPPGGYDSIRVRINWSNYDHSGGDSLSGNSENYVIDLDKFLVNTSDLDILVIGVRNDIPSNAAAIHVNNNIQEELYGIPFTSGLAPNWQSWILDVNGGKISPQMGVRNELTVAKGHRYNPITTADKKPFYQIINTSNKGGTGGVFRKFIGLTPGNTYRLSARLSILKADTNEKGWSYSLHATADKAGIEKLTENQMAGLASLPDGKSGPQAGRLKVLDSTSLTGGKYEECSSDITLPEDSNSITVWLRLTGKNASTVGFDWIRLEKLCRKASPGGGIK